MKNLFFALAFMLTGTFDFASNSAKEELILEKPVIELTVKVQEDIDESKCYRQAVDDFGNTYFAQVPCPPVIILE